MEARLQDSSQRKILIAENDQELGEKLVVALHKFSYLVDLVGDGQKTLELVNNQTYDGLLLNLVLPKISGIDVLTAIRRPDSRNKNLSIFVMTSNERRNLIKDVFTLGVERIFFRSQLNPEAMAEEVKNFFAANQNQSQVQQKLVK